MVPTHIEFNIAITENDDETPIRTQRIGSTVLFTNLKQNFPSI